MTRWPNQVRHNEEIQRLYAPGRRVCVTSPTGTGKTRMILDAIQWAQENVGPVVLYTHRKMLLEQTKDWLETSEMDFGVRASGHRKHLEKDIQIAMVPSERQAVFAKQKRALHFAKVVLVDEAHAQTGPTMHRILDDHVAAGAYVIGYTATPLDIGDLYGELVVAGTNSELRGVGALVPCHTWAPCEPDLKSIKRYKIGEDLSEADNAKAIMRPGIFGRVYDNWKRLNPDARPTILFGPDVAGSLYFAEEFRNKGIASAHIDGSDVWVNGQQYRTSQQAREDIMGGSRDGTIRVVCNRFVLREGVDFPWLYCALFASVFGALSSFLQAGGRLLRAHKSLEHVIAIDFGGNWHRHGSLNADRQWELSQTNRLVGALRADAMRQKKEPEPICCPKCQAMRFSGPKCPKCGYEYHGKSRLVVQIDGTLKEMKGDIYKPRRVKEYSNTQALWDRCYYGARKSGRSFAQAEAWFFQQFKYWPPRTLNNMPTSDVDFYRAVSQVPRECLKGARAGKEALA